MDKADGNGRRITSLHDLTFSDQVIKHPQAGDWVLPATLSVNADRELAGDIVVGLNTARAKSFSDEGMMATFEFVALGEAMAEWLGTGPNMPQSGFDDDVANVGVGAGVEDRKAMLTVRPSTKDMNASTVMA